MTTQDFQAGPAAGEGRYSAIAIALHWAVALLILAEIGIGWYMNDVMVDHSPPQEAMQDFHIALGLTAMILIAVRIVVRLTHRPPALPPGMPSWETGLAHAAHVLFYVLMIAMPLTGWALIASRHAPIPFWGLNWPGFPGIDAIGGAANRPARNLLKAVHNDYLVWIAVANIVLHVAGAVKHQFDGHPVLWRMLPGARR